MSVKISAALATGNWTDEIATEEEAIQLAEDLIGDIEATSNERFRKFTSTAWRHYWKSNFGHTVRISVSAQSTFVGTSQYFAD